MTSCKRTSAQVRSIVHEIHFPSLHNEVLLAALPLPKSQHTQAKPPLDFQGTQRDVPIAGPALCIGCLLSKVTRSMGNSNSMAAPWADKPGAKGCPSSGSTLTSGAQYTAAAPEKPGPPGKVQHRHNILPGGQARRRQRPGGKLLLV